MFIIPINILHSNEKIALLCKKKSFLINELYSFVNIENIDRKIYSNISNKNSPNN